MREREEKGRKEEREAGRAGERDTHCECQCSTTLPYTNWPLVSQIMHTDHRTHLSAACHARKRESDACAHTPHAYQSHVRNLN